MTKQSRRTIAVTSKGMNGSANQSVIPDTNGMIAALLRKVCEFNHVPDMTEGLQHSTMWLHKPSVNSVTRLSSTDLPPMQTIPCGRSAEFNGGTDLTARFAQFSNAATQTFSQIGDIAGSRRPSANVSDSMRKVTGIQQCYRFDRRFAQLNIAATQTFGEVTNTVEFRKLEPVSAIPCGRSAEFNIVTCLTEGLRCSTMQLRKPSVR